jgi:class 3 adenylate cyclase
MATAARVGDRASCCVEQDLAVANAGEGVSTPVGAGPYVSALIRDGLEPGNCALQGTFVKTDVTGFTPLTERLARSGRIGAEVVGTAMDRCFGVLIDRLIPVGGDVVFFGGDALFIAFQGGGHAARAVEGAHLMLDALPGLNPIDTPLGPVRIRMSLGVASGVVDVVVGDGPQRPLFLSGPTVTRTVQLEASAGPGEVYVDAVVAEQIGQRRMQPIGDGVFRSMRRRSGAVRTASAAARGDRNEPLSLAVTGRPDLHLPAALRTALLGGGAPTDHRHVTVAFVRIVRLDGRPRMDRINVLARASRIVGEACALFDVAWLETDVAADGAMIILVAGVPHQHDDDELRLAAAARRVVESELAGDVAIGIHRGTAFVGAVGHAARRCYTVNGNTVITAARLMSRAADAEVLAGAEVADRLRGRHETGRAHDLIVKGRRQPIRAVALVPLTATHQMPGAPSGVGPSAMPTLVGRRRERVALEAALERHEAGVGMIVEIVGPAGIGKSALLGWFLERAPVPRLSIAGEVARSVVAFGAVSGPLRTALRVSTVDEASGALRRAGDLGPLLGAVLDLELAPTAASAMVEAASVAAVRADLVAELLGAPAGLLVIDDAHWLDPTSVQLLGPLLRTLASSGWLVVVARRPGVAAMSVFAESLVLDPLSDDDVGRLAVSVPTARPLSDAVLAAVVERSAGVPLWAIQLAASAEETTDVGLVESSER